MHRGFFQYLYSLSFALLTVLGLYYGQMQQYISTDDSSDLDFAANILVRENKTSEDSLDFFSNNYDSDFYNHTRPHYSKIRALSESDNENDEKVETSSFPEFSVVLRENSWRLTFGFVTSYHDKQSAVSLAHSKQLTFPDDDLYIQYRVIRL